MNGNYVGIDYSMRSPAIVTIPKEKEFKFENCSCFYLTDKKKLVERLHNNIIGSAHKEYTFNEKRFDFIGNWALQLLTRKDCVVMEGYAMGAKGTVFHIGELTGVLKHKMFHRQILFDVVAPSSIKKFATGKGNANKEAMYTAFVEETGVDLMKFFPSNVLSSPVSDIIDAFYMCKYAHDTDKNLLE